MGLLFSQYFNRHNDEMRFGIMLRHLDQPGGGVRGYTENLLREFFAMDREHEFVLLYQNPNLVGTYGHHDNVQEIAVPVHSKFLWDQITVPRIEKKLKLEKARRTSKIALR